MVCLEVSVNGRRQCVAGLNRTGTYLTAEVFQGPSTGGPFLMVAGTSESLEPRFAQWIEHLSLNAGDVVTIQVSEASEADPPAQIVEQTLPPERPELEELLRLVRAPSTMSATLRTLLFWMVVVILGIVIWNFATTSTQVR